MFVLFRLAFIVHILIVIDLPECKWLVACAAVDQINIVGALYSLMRLPQSMQFTIVYMITSASIRQLAAV